MTLGATAHSTLENKPLVMPERTHTPVSYTHLRAHETVLDLVCRLLLEKKKNYTLYTYFPTHSHTLST